jgi:hypothetical protein
MSEEFMTDREALKLALDAIETYSPDYMHGLPKKYYIKAIQEALEQPEQELICVCGAVWERQELVSTPPKRTWVGLTEAERVDIIDIEISAPETEHFALAQSIEAALKEKNK